MCSPSSNHQVINSSSCIVGEQESEDTSRDNYNQPPNQLSDMGMRYMNIPNDNNRFTSDSVSSQSPVYSLEPSIQNTSQSSNLGISPYHNYYPPPTQNLSAYSNGHGAGGSAYFAPNSLFSSMSDSIKPPRLSSLYVKSLAYPHYVFSFSLINNNGTSSHTSSGYSQSRDSPILSHISPPLPGRDLYSNHTPVFQRRTSDLLTRSPSLSGPLRSPPISPNSTSGFTSPIANMNDSLGGNPVPPLYGTEVHYSLTTSDGQTIKPEIFGRIDKGFFMADNDWTCYRRNYFSLNCSYGLMPLVPTGTIYLQLHGVPLVQVHAFSMSIAAVVDGRDGKPIELVQHTPKRDKGPQKEPARIVLAPRPPAVHGTYDGIGGRANVFDAPGFTANQNQTPTEATFERIQFKNATANNGKRRAAQQYYHLLVELFADVGNQHVDRHIKIASRMSAPMVVRGRSPGHYQSERRGSNHTGNGHGGPGGGSAGSYTSSGTMSRTSGDISMGGISSMLPGPSFNSNYDNRSHHYRSAIPPLNIPIDSNISMEEAKNMDDNTCLVYFPGSVWYPSDSRFQLPVPEYSAKVKNDGGYLLPSLSSSGQDGGLSSRHCGRWNNAPDTKGIFSISMVQQGMNFT